MKYNKLLKKALALGLVATMVAVPTPIMAARDAEIVVDNLTEKGVIDVELPTELVFAIDPMQISTNNGQIASSDLVIYNRSNFPIRVDATTSLTFTDDIKLHSAKDMRDEERYKDTSEKHIYFGISVLKEATVDEIDTETNDIAVENGIKKATLTYTNIEDNIKNPELPTDPIKSLEAEVTKNGAGTSIILNEAQLDSDGTPAYGDADKAKAAKALGAVKFVGLVNPNADWKAGDITANMVFDISGVSSLVYDLAINGNGKQPADVGYIGSELLGNSKIATRIQAGVEEKLPPAIANPTVDETDKNDVKIEFTLNVADAQSKTAVKPTRVTDITISSGIAGATPKDEAEEAYDIAWDGKSFTSTYNETTKKIDVVMAGKDVPDVETAKAQLETITSGVHNVKLKYDNGTEQVIKIDFAKTPANP